MTPYYTPTFTTCLFLFLAIYFFHSLARRRHWCFQAWLIPGCQRMGCSPGAWRICAFFWLFPGAHRYLNFPVKVPEEGHHSLPNTPEPWTPAPGLPCPAHAVNFTFRSSFQVLLILRGGSLLCPVYRVLEIPVCWGGPGSFRERGQSELEGHCRRTPAKLGEPTGLSVSLFYRNSARCPMALSSSMSVGSSMRKRHQVTMWIRVLRA